MDAGFFFRQRVKMNIFYADENGEITSNPTTLTNEWEQDI
jgi:hypothetical protein